MHACVHTHIHACMHMHTYTRTYVHAHIHVSYTQTTQNGNAFSITSTQIYYLKHTAMVITTHSYISEYLQSMCPSCFLEDTEIFAVMSTISV